MSAAEPHADVAPVRLTRFEDRFAQSKTEELIDLESLCTAVRTTSASAKEQLPLIKLATFGDLRTKRRSLRSNANVLAITGVEADYDNERVSFEDACGIVSKAGVTAVVYTSPSHTDDAPRWRVICPFSKEYLPARRDAFMGRLNGLFGGIFSAESWTLSQPYYLGSVKNNPSHRAENINVNGTPIDLLEALDETWIGRPGAREGSAIEQGKDRPIRSGAEYVVSDKRLEAYRNAVLDGLRRDAVDGQKHVRLRGAGRTLGGIQAAAGFSNAVGIQWLLDCLPDTVGDWVLAGSTAAWALAKGREQPITLGDRPLDRRRSNGASHARGNSGENGSASGNDATNASDVNGHDAAATIDAPPHGATHTNSHDEAAAKPAPQVTKPSASTRRSRAYSDDIDGAAEDGLPPGYTLTEAGLYYREPPGDDEKPARPQWIAGPHEVLGHARDTTSSNWGLVLRWLDRAGVQHIWCVPVGLAYGTGGELSAGFASQGLACATSASGKERLRTYIARHRPPRLVTAVTATGWFRDSFVLADRTIIGPNQDEVFLQTPQGAADQAYAQAGDLDQWKRHVAAYAIGNHHLALAMTTTLSGPLYHLVNEPNGGWQLVGDSRSGKSTILAGAASVWGPPTPSGFLSSWRATSNGLESMCAARCDTALVLDEISQGDPRDVGAAVYMICNGAGKSRADRTGAGRPPQTWRLPLLSSGEKTLGQMMEQAGLSVAAGQDVRLPVIRPALGAAHGWFQELHGEMSGAGLSDLVRQGARDYHGTAGREFARKLIEARRCDPDELLDQIKRTMAEFLSEENVAGADGQGITVARRFALCSAAGELAIRFDVLPWPVGEAKKAMHACYRAWAAERGGAGTSEAHRAVERVRGFIERFGDSRFEPVGVFVKREGEPGHRVVQDRVGYRRTVDGAPEYDVLSTAWSEVVCRGLDAKAAARALHDAGYLIAPPPEPDRKFRPNGPVTINNESLRLYRIKGSIIQGEP